MIDPFSIPSFKFDKDFIWGSATALDNYEWRSFLPKFGLVSVDRNNGYARKIKPSGYFLREIIENNGYDREMLGKYIKEIPRSKYHLDY